ncbi:hypothetical protein O181_067700 [Austropuccinia psidii MF-1]|uniref:Uncharacterized protein n=1 Tax=Austropuccinia psidii MF-1 TaxID=1389203 RepID=A0A9Q3ER90_9BASI|nr:hypothetical protein [Austropuccinia psidii MF-1]
MINIDPSVIMENKDITKHNIQSSKIEIRKSEQEFLKELIQEQKEESETYLPERNNLFHIPTSKMDPIFKEYLQQPKTFNRNRKVKKQIPPGNKSIKQRMTAAKESDINKNKDLIKPKSNDSTNTRNNIEQDFSGKPSSVKWNM